LNRVQNLILVVDDEDTIRQFVRAVLERGGYTVAVASNGDEALETIHRWSPDLLLTDIVMPGMSGIGLAARAHQLRPKMPVIFMSGYADQYETELSGSVCLRKPFTPSQLLVAIGDVADAQRALTPGDV
jgi:two-component system cell cycle sensor histidine kinase/response regulator CckA